MKKNTKVPPAPAAQQEEIKDVTLRPAAATFHNDFVNDPNMLDNNHIVDCLKGMKEMVHDDPMAAQRYNLTEDQVNYFNEITLCGFATMLAIHVQSGKSEWAARMSTKQIEAFNAVSEYTGVSIDVKALPAPAKETPNIVEVPATAVKVEKQTATEIKEELTEAKKQINLDPTKFENNDDFLKAVNHILQTKKNAFSKFERTVSLYRSYHKILAGDDEAKKQAIDDMSYGNILDEVFAEIDRVPVLLSGFGKALYNKASQFANPVVAFCMLRESSRNKTTGIPAVDDATIASIVKVLIKYCANKYIADYDAKIETAKADIEVLSKDKKKNANGIKDLEEKIKTYEHNKEHIADVIEFTYNPSSDVADSFINDYDDKGGENYKAAREIFGFIVRAFYDVDKAKTYNQTALKQNVQQYIGVIDNMFRGPGSQLMAYKEANIVDLEEGTEKN